MSVHYKFKSSLDFDTFTFDGLHISVSDLKKAIIHKKRLSKVNDCDLQITNAQSNEEYSDDSYLIPKNSSLIIARVPLLQPHKRPTQPEQQPQTRCTVRDENIGSDLTQMKGSEEDKINAMMLQSSADYDPKSYQRTKGISQTGDIPSTYRCNKCKKSGHWIKNCPYIVEKDHIEVRRNTGIPKSLRSNETSSIEAKVKDAVPFVKEMQEIPEELLCSLCNDIFIDAVMIPCCGSSFCDDCVRTALLESENNECPDCKEKGSSPGSLIPNRFLRNSVNSYKNETGYTTIPLKKSKDIQNNSKDQDESKNVVEADSKSVVEADSKKVIETDTKKVEASEALPKSPVSASNGDVEKKTNIEEEAFEKNLTKPTQDNSKVSQPIKTHDFESDYEDNITVTMPSAQRDIENEFMEKPYNIRDIRHPKMTRRDCSPRHLLQAPTIKSESVINNLPEKWEPDNRYCEDRMPHARMYNNAPYYKHHPEPSAKGDRMFAPIDLQPHPIGLIVGHDIYAGPNQNVKAYQQPKHHPLSIPRPFYNEFHEASHNSNMRYPHPHYVHPHPPYQNPNYGFQPLKKFLDDINQTPSSHLASVYEGVAAKVGNGIIDDPLEAFNRIMKEKEKNKERRTPEFRRSRSNDSQPRSRVRSSQYDHKVSRDISKRERERPHTMGKKCERHDKRSNHNRRLTPEKFSRSRSWSKSPQMRSWSPISKNLSQNRSNIHGNKFSQLDRRTKDTSSTRNKTRDSQHDRSSLQRKQEMNANSVNICKKVEKKEYEGFEPPPPGFEEGAYPYGRPSKIVQDNAPNSYDKRGQYDNSSQQGRQNNFAFKVDTGNDFRSLTPTFKLSPHERDEPAKNEVRMGIDLDEGKTTKPAIYTEKLTSVQERPHDVRKIHEIENEFMEKNVITNTTKNIESVDRIEEKAEMDIEIRKEEPWTEILTEKVSKVISGKGETKNKKLKERKKKKERSERKKSKKIKKEKRTRGRERDKNKHKHVDTSKETTRGAKNDSDHKNFETDMENNEKTIHHIEDAKHISLGMNKHHKKTRSRQKSFCDNANEFKIDDINILNEFSSSKSGNDTVHCKDIEKTQTGDEEYKQKKHFNTTIKKDSFDLDSSQSASEKQKSTLLLLKPELSRWEIDDIYTTISKEKQEKPTIDKTNIIVTNEANSESKVFNRDSNITHHFDGKIDSRKVSNSKLDQHVSNRSEEKNNDRHSEKKSRLHSVEAKKDKKIAIHSLIENKSVKYRLESKIVNKTKVSPTRNLKRAHNRSRSKERTTSKNNSYHHEARSYACGKSNESKTSKDMHSFKIGERRHKSSNGKYNAEPRRTYDVSIKNKSNEMCANNASNNEFKKSYGQKYERKERKNAFNTYIHHKRSSTDKLDCSKHTNKGTNLEQEYGAANKSRVFSEIESEQEYNRSKKRKKPKYKKDKKRQRHASSSHDSAGSEYRTPETKNMKSEKQKN